MQDNFQGKEGDKGTTGNRRVQIESFVVLELGKTAKLQTSNAAESPVFGHCIVSSTKRDLLPCCRGWDPAL